jgi:predicted nucleic acid-binding protein
MMIVCNTTPFIALASVGKIELLQKNYGSLIVPEAVVEEIEHGGKIYVPSLTSMNWISVVANETGQNNHLLFQLDYGERQVILHALKIQPDMVLIDDKTARDIAEFLGLKVKGTLGVLAEAKRKGLIPSFKEPAMMMKAQGIRFSQKLIEEIALSLGE